MQLVFDILQVFVVLVLLHFTTDFTFQTERQAIHKSRLYPHEAVSWQWWLISHSFTQGFFILVATGSIVLALLNSFFHMFVDNGKCEEIISLEEDQLLHLVTNLGIAIVWVRFYSDYGLLRFITW